MYEAVKDASKPESSRKGHSGTSFRLVTRAFFKPPTLLQFCHFTNWAPYIGSVFICRNMENLEILFRCLSPSLHFFFSHQTMSSPYQAKRPRQQSNRTPNQKPGRPTNGRKSLENGWLLRVLTDATATQQLTPQLMHNINTQLLGAAPQEAAQQLFDAASQGSSTVRILCTFLAQEAGETCVQHVGHMCRQVLSASPQTKGYSVEKNASRYPGEKLNSSWKPATRSRHVISSADLPAARFQKCATSIQGGGYRLLCCSDGYQPYSRQDNRSSCPRVGT